ncbi:hypothetical protein GCM10008908_03150 [Clostridium subterminale]|uniref:Uncharacterized protein n=1 Tax=Clostridium subterminale TaxID=1550 RepID=A0ABP3VQF3_CLOSU
MVNRTSVSILIQDMMNKLEEIGIHSILVRSKEEAKNFIMYHIDIGTQVKMDDCLELNDLNLEKAITEKGGTILNNKVEDLELKEGKKRRSTISELDLYGCSHILDEFTEFTHYTTENNDLLSCIDGIKTIAVINIDSNDIFYNKLLPIYNKLMDIDSEKIVNLKANISQKDDNDMDSHKIQRNIRQKNLNIDISIVFIE